jgi:hypothetical protein
MRHFETRDLLNTLLIITPCNYRQHNTMSSAPLQVTAVKELSKVSFNIFINYNFSKHIHQLIISLLDE